MPSRWILCFGFKHNTRRAHFQTRPLRCREASDPRTWIYSPTKGWKGRTSSPEGQWGLERDKEWEGRSTQSSWPDLDVISWTHVPGKSEVSQASNSSCFLNGLSSCARPRELVGTRGWNLKERPHPGPQHHPLWPFLICPVGVALCSLSIHTATDKPSLLTSKLWKSHPMFYF